MYKNQKEKTKQECIHIHVIKLMMRIMKSERVKEKPVRRICSAGLDTK
jgi:hypothetical protein